MIITEEDENIMRNITEAAIRCDEEQVRSLLKNLNIRIDTLQTRTIVRKVLRRLYEIARKVESERQYLLLAGIAISLVKTRTLEDELDYLSYLAAVEEIEVKDPYNLTIVFKRLPILALDILEKIDPSYYNLNINVEDHVRASLKLATDLYLNYIVRRVLYPLAIATELVDVLLRRVKRMSVKRLLEINCKILNVIRDNICINIRKLMDSGIIDNLKLSNEITIIDYSRSKISGRLHKDVVFREEVLVEPVDKIVKIGDIIVLWHI